MRTGTRSRIHWGLIGAGILGLGLVGCTVRSGEESSPVVADRRVVASDPSLQGQVVDEAGNPLDAAKVLNWFPHGSNSQVTYNRKDGVFYFAERRGYALRADKKGFAPTFEEFHDRYNSPAAKKGPLKITLTMSRGGTVRGTVLDKKSGQPIKGEEIHIDRAAFDPGVGLNA